MFIVIFLILFLIIINLTTSFKKKEKFVNPYYKNSNKIYSIPSSFKLHRSNIFESTNKNIKIKQYLENQKKIKQPLIDLKQPSFGTDGKLKNVVLKKVNNDVLVCKKKKKFLPKKKTLALENEKSRKNLDRRQNLIKADLEKRNFDEKEENKLNVRSKKIKNKNIIKNKKEPSVENSCSFYSYDDKYIFTPKQMIINPIEPENNFIDSERPIFGNELKKFFENFELDKKQSEFVELEKYQYNYSEGVRLEKVNDDLIKKMIKNLTIHISTKLENYLNKEKPKVCNNVNKCKILFKKNKLLMIGINESKKYIFEGQLLLTFKNKNSEFLVHYVISNESSEKEFKLYFIKLIGFDFIKMKGIDSSENKQVKIYSNPIVNKYNANQTYTYSSNEDILNKHTLKEKLKNSKNFVTKKDKIRENREKSDYRCYNKVADTKSQCENLFDNNGKIQQFGTWDKKCVTNEECPFYKKNLNYPNNYGRCNNGWCEMPVGLKQLSPRKFINLDKVACHNCKTKIDCCIEQQDKSKYPNLKSPDYYFKNDTDLRMKNKKILNNLNLKVI